MSIVGYWAFKTIEPGDLHVSKERQAELEAKNKELEQEIAKLKSELADLQPPKQEMPANQTLNTNPTTTKPPLSKYQDLITSLQKLLDQKAVLKLKSTGTQVGTLQTFLNIYNNTSKKVDNDFGPGTKTDIMNFQKAEGLPVTGEAGVLTFQKMIDWLNQQ